MSTTRAKFRCHSLEEVKNSEGVVEGRTAKFHPVYGDTPENKEFFKASPGGSLELYYVNPNVKIEANKEYYLDLTEAPAAQ